MKVWITKYALKQGIIEKEAEPPKSTSMIIVRGDREAGRFDENYHGTEWWATREAARHHANFMVENKIRSLKRQLKKLEDLEF